MAVHQRSTSTPTLPMQGTQVMHDYGTISTTDLRERAAKCRRLADRTHSAGVAVELEKLATDYERDAALLEGAHLEFSGAGWVQPHPKEGPGAAPPAE